jgi:hypothetical protein
MIHYHLVRENYSGWANVPVDLLVPLTQENLDRCDQEILTRRESLPFKLDSGTKDE